jgi:hypothetical protein
MISSSDGMSPELGPSLGPNGSTAPVGCLSRSTATTLSSTVATAAVPASLLAALPSRPSSTSLTAVVVLGAVPSLGSGLGQSTRGYRSSRALSPCLSPGASPALGRARMLRSVSSPGSAKKASARRSTHPANTPAEGPNNGLCTVGRSSSERKRSKGESGGGVDGVSNIHRVKLLDVIDASRKERVRVRCGHLVYKYNLWPTQHDTDRETLAEHMHPTWKRAPVVSVRRRSYGTCW